METPLPIAMEENDEIGVSRKLKNRRRIESRKVSVRICRITQESSSPVSTLTQKNGQRRPVSAKNSWKMTGKGKSSEDHLEMADIGQRMEKRRRKPAGRGDSARLGSEGVRDGTGSGPSGIELLLTRHRSSNGQRRAAGAQL